MSGLQTQKVIPPKGQETEVMAKVLQQELEQNIERLGTELFGGQPGPGTKEVSDEELAGLFKANWDSESNRFTLLKAVGPETFVATAEKLGYYRRKGSNASNDNDDSSTSASESPAEPNGNPTAIPSNPTAEPPGYPTSPTPGV